MEDPRADFVASTAKNDIDVQRAIFGGDGQPVDAFC